LREAIATTGVGRRSSRPTQRRAAVSLRLFVLPSPDLVLGPERISRHSSQGSSSIRAAALALARALSIATRHENVTANDQNRLSPLRSQAPSLTRIAFGAGATLGQPAPPRSTEVERPKSARNRSFSSWNETGRGPSGLLLIPRSQVRILYGPSRQTKGSLLRPRMRAERVEHNRRH
jgi:hypothetical protein